MGEKRKGYWVVGCICCERQESRTRKSQPPSQTPPPTRIDRTQQPVAPRLTRSGSKGKGMRGILNSRARYSRSTPTIRNWKGLRTCEFWRWFEKSCVASRAGLACRHINTEERKLGLLHLLGLHSPKPSHTPSTSPPKPQASSPPYQVGLLLLLRLLPRRCTSNTPPLLSSQSIWPTAL